MQGFMFGGHGVRSPHLGPLFLGLSSQPIFQETFSNGYWGLEDQETSLLKSDG